MAKDPKPLSELYEKATDSVEQTKEQVLGAVDQYFKFLLQTISSYPSGGTDLGEKLKSYAEKNIAATQEFIHRLGQAKDFQDALRIQAEFMQSQFTALSEQTKSLGEAYTRSAADAMNKTTKF